jgi:hypothetical protein
VAGLQYGWFAVILLVRKRVRRWILRWAAPLGPPWPMRRWVPVAVLGAVLLAVALVPTSGSLAGQQPACAGSCRVAGGQVVAWTIPLSGAWSAEDGVAGTIPASGEAYVSAGGGLVAMGSGLYLDGFAEATGKVRWTALLSGFPSGSAIISVRAWPGVVTAGVLTPRGQRIEVAVDAATGNVIRVFPAARFGGAVAASPSLIVIVGNTAVTGYNTSTGRVRWRVGTGPLPPAWRVNGGMLYLTESAGGFMRSGPVTALRVIDLGSGTQRTIVPPAGNHFPGDLSDVGEGVLLFSGALGVTAYDAVTGRWLWFAPGAVPEGDDPYRHWLYLTVGNSLESVRPLTGAVVAKIPGSSSGAAAGIYAVRNGVALGLDAGSGGSAWGYSLPMGRIIWSVSGLGYPHYFTDLSGLGGSMSTDSRLVVIAACTHAVTPQPTPSDTASPSPSASASLQPTPPATPSASPSGSPSTASPTPSVTTAPPPPPQACEHPELVGLWL